MMMGAGGGVIEEKSREMVSSSSAGFCYSEVHMGNNQIPGGFVSDPDMFNLTTSMDMIGFSNKNHHLHDSSAAAATWQDQSRLLVDDSSFRCVFPCEGNERPSQGLSLSLSSNNPLSIGLQSFELRHSTNHHLHLNHPHDHHPDFVSSSSTNTRDKLLGKSVNNIPADANNLVYQPHYALKNSKYLAPAQQLLNEFCSLGTKQSGDLHLGKHKSSSHQKNKEREEDDNGIKKHAVGSLEFVELQKRKTKLLAMLEEVERRYRHYCSQMKGVVSSFEAVAGNGAARVYSALALKAMSRHFRCLKDGILGEIETTRRSMGEKDPVAPGTTKGETPRLRIIDQTIRQQRAFQQMNMMESHPWRPQRGLPERSVSLLRAWLFEHFLHPYPSDMDKHILARQTGLSRSQVSNWFINARVRLWKPMVEEMYMEELKEQEQDNNNMNVMMGSSSDHGVDDNTRNAVVSADQKPIQEQQQQRLLRIDSDCVSSIIMSHPTTTTLTDQKKESNSKNINHHDHHHHHHHNMNNDAFGCVELDFSSYSGGGMVCAYSSSSSRNEENMRNGGGGGVSLTLGLQQEDGESGNNGVSLAFPAPPTHHHQSNSSLFFARDQMEDCQAGIVHHQYSLLDAEPQINLPYRNLMGAQLLHDLAG